MSYILDALKKSERERRRGSIPDPLTMEEAMPQIRKKRILWPYFIIIALALNAVVFVFWSGLLHPKSVSIVRSASGRPESSVEKRPLLSSAGKTEGSRAAKEITSSEARPVSDSIRSESEKNAYRKKSLSPGAEANKKTRDHDKTPLETGDNHAASPASSAETAGKHLVNAAKPDHVPPPIPNRLYNLSELPLSVRQSLPDFSVSVSLYSDDAATRLARINGNIMKEGQYLSGGLKLEEIVPAGVIFSYQSYRFLIGPK